jgi:signal peptidase I
MLPTIGKDDLCVANPFAYTTSDIERFDLVVFTPNKEQVERFNDPNLRYLQRVIGFPGEKIEIRNSRVYINDQMLDEPFQKIFGEQDAGKNVGPILIPADAYFMMGDNRPNSEDSRYWSTPTINKANIHSKIVDIQKDFYRNQ